MAEQKSAHPGNTDQTANDGSKVKDHPEERNVTTFVAFAWVRHHDHTLGGPQATRATSQKGASENDKAIVLSVVVAQERGNVDAVADSTKGQSNLHAHSVDDAAGEET